MSQQQQQQSQLLYGAQVATDESYKNLCDLVDAYKKDISLLRTEHEKIQKGHAELSHREQELVKQNNSNNNDETVEIDDNDVVEINAGGLPMTVTRGILTQIKGSPLEALFSGRWENKLLRDKEGRIFLDVNPSFFESIVDYLNEFKINTPPDGSPLPDLPRVDKDDQLYLDQLMTTFGIAPHTELDTTTIDDPKHIQALYEFLSEDEINGELKLLYRGSRDGFKAADFHSRCDNKGPTITIIKDVGGYLFGGFVNASWGTNNGIYTSCDKAFLFTLHCQSGVRPTKMRIRSDSTQIAICSTSDYGPTFGGGHDLHVYNNCNLDTSNHTAGIGHSYEKPEGQNEDFLTGNEKFQVSEIEVFKVADFKKRCKLNSSAFYLSNVASQVDSSSSEPWQSATYHEFPEQFKDSLMKEQAALILAKYDLQKRQMALDKEEAFIDYFASGDTKDIITFNVRGRVMETKRSVLGIFSDSVLAKQFCDPLWANAKGCRNEKIGGVKEWDSTNVSSWIDAVKGLSTEVTTILKEQVLNGAELLALDREELKEMGIARPASVGLIMKEIRELRNVDDGTTVIDHNNYCFEKMLDHLRFVTLCKAQGGPSTPSPPIIKDHESKRFKEFVEYYFPNDTAPFILSD